MNYGASKRNRIKFFLGLFNFAQDSLEKKAISTFGTTDDFRNAGFILKNGTMLDFSEKILTKENNDKKISHNNIFQIFEEEISKDDASIYFIRETGAVRVSAIRNFIFFETYNPITTAQNHLIRKIISNYSINLIGLMLSKEEKYIEYNNDEQNNFKELFLSDINNIR